MTLTERLVARIRTMRATPQYGTKIHIDVHSPEGIHAITVPHGIQDTELQEFVQSWVGWTQRCWDEANK